MYRYLLAILLAVSISISPLSIAPINAAIPLVVIPIGKGLAWLFGLGKGGAAAKAAAAAAAAAREAAQRKAAAEIAKQAAIALARKAAQKKAATEVAKRAAIAAAKKKTTTQSLAANAGKIGIKENIKSGVIQEGVSQVIKFAIKSAIRKPITPAMKNVFQTQSIRIANNTKKYFTIGNTVTFVGSTVLTTAIWDSVANALEIRESDNIYDAAKFKAELAAGIERKEKEFFIKVCDHYGKYSYGVPTSANTCSDGSSPQMIEEAINLSKFTKYCVSNEGFQYEVPYDAVKCSNGSNPRFKN